MDDLEAYEEALADLRVALERERQAREQAQAERDEERRRADAAERDARAAKGELAKVLRELARQQAAQRERGAVPHRPAGRPPSSGPWIGGGRARPQWDAGSQAA